MDTGGYAQWFRASTPYISAHRNRTFVVLLSGEAMDHGNLANIVHDLALLHVLGARLVLVHGARPQIDLALPNCRFHGHRRITDRESLSTVLGVYGQLRAQLEAFFSTGLPTSPLRLVKAGKHPSPCESASAGSCWERRWEMRSDFPPKGSLRAARGASSETAGGIDSCSVAGC